MCWPLRVIRLSVSACDASDLPYTPNTDHHRVLHDIQLEGPVDRLAFGAIGIRQ